MVLGSDNQFIEMRDGFAKGTLPLATTMGCKQKKWSAKGLPTGATTPRRYCLEQKMGGKVTLTLATTGHNSLILYPGESVKLGKVSFWGF